ncbi:MAG: hypothetical protein HFG58_06355 [Lachnospiraceae bacterium]|nr:hypothetical protein [Lachnospiraceae bacterium]
MTKGHLRDLYATSSFHASDNSSLKRFCQWGISAFFSMPVRGLLFMGRGVPEGTPWNREARRLEMVCCFFRFRDQEFLKFPIFAKSETKIHKLAALRQCEFSFQRKTREFKDF